jgi:hypothetical protein
MKKLRVSLSLAAFAFAVGGAFASQTLATEMGYEFVSTNPVGQKCVQRNDCQDVSGDACTITGTTTPISGLQTGQDACAKPLFRIVP